MKAHFGYQSFARLWVLFSAAICAFVAAAQAPVPGPAPVEAAVLTDAAKAGSVTFWVVFKGQADLSDARRNPDWVARGQMVHDRLRGVAEASQDRAKGLLRRKNAQFRSFWILNTMQVKGDSTLVAQLASLPEVKEIVAEKVLKIPETKAAYFIPSTGGVEWNIHRIGAPTVWSNYLATGQGIVVCNIDTGVQFDHPALVNQYRGKTESGFQHDYNWFEPASATALPYPHDEGGHGTHTMGTIVGSSGPDNLLGVAPGAKWIAAKACRWQTCDFADLMACAQWVLAPTDLAGNNPMPSLRPNIVNNSWGIEFSDPWFRGIVQQWVAAGIFPVFSAGNLGSYGCLSIGSPADYPESYAVGSSDFDSNLSYFSSMGPAIDGLTKPNITAPGSDIRSAVPGSAYGVASGTSMAAPHVAGAVALLWSAAPALKGDVEATRRLLDRTAVDKSGPSCGGSATNNTMFGEGMLDISLTVAQAPLGTPGSLAGVITNNSTTLPVAGVEVVLSGPVDTSILTTGSGAYTFPSVPFGSYVLTVNAFGYEPFTNAAIVVDGSNTFNIGLTPSATEFSVSGFVKDAENEPIEGARVLISNATNAPVFTGADGAYNLGLLPAGTHVITVDPTCCYEAGTRTVQLTNNLTDLNFTFAAHTDMHGYRCTVVAPAYVEATHELGLNGDDFYTTTNLPFPFTFYGKTYTNLTIFCDGYVQFESVWPQYFNQILPTPMLPNNAIYAFWDELWVGATNSIRIATNGVSPNQRFIVEWRGVYIKGTTSPIDFEIILEQNGRILCQYRNIPDTFIHRGGAATFGIENGDGTLALQYSMGEASLESPSFAIEYWSAPAAYIHGQVTDANDGQPVSKAQIEVEQGGRVRRITTGVDGRYTAQLPLGVTELRASGYNYLVSTNVAGLSVAGVTNVVDFALRSPRIEASATSLNYQVVKGQSTTFTLSITNTGTTNLFWELRQVGGAAVSGTPSRVRNPLADPDAPHARETFLGAEVAGWPAEHGDVLASWRPEQAPMPWGIATYSNTVLVSDSSVYTNGALPDVFRYSISGSFQQSSDTITNGWVADLAYDSQHKLLCHVIVGGSAPYTNAIACVDPSTGMVVTNITGPWSTISQRGLAYRPDDDTFYIGGWNEGIIYHIKGLSWDEPGAVLDQFTPFSQSIAGLAWNSTHNVLWMVSNETLDRIFAMDPVDGSILASLSHPDPGFNGAGLECDPSGRLWTISQGLRQVFLIETRLQNFTNVAWIGLSVTNGVLAPGERQNVQITADASTLDFGSYAATLFLNNNGGRAPQMLLPVEVSVIEDRPWTTAVAAGTLRNNFTGWVGTRVVTGSKAIKLTALGRYAAPGNANLHEVRLLRESDRQVMASAQVNMASSVPGNYVYTYLATPVQLAPNTSYFLLTSEVTGGDAWYDIDTALTTTAAANATAGVYSWNGSIFYTYGQGSRSFGPADFRYEQPPTVLRALNLFADVPGGQSQNVLLELDPPDESSAASGLTPLVRTYINETIVTVTAPTALDGARFARWTSGGVEVSLNPVLSVTLTNDLELTAVYAPLPFTHDSYVQSVVLGTLRNNHNGYVGMRFKTGPVPVTVSALGRWRVAGNTQLHKVKLVRVADASDVPGGTVFVDAAQGTAGQFQYSVLPSAVTLAANTEYMLLSREFSGGDQWYDCNTAINTSGVAQSLAGAYSFGESLAYYTYCGAGFSYTPVDFKHIPLGELTIQSIDLQGPATITVTPSDVAGAGTGATPLQLRYNYGTAVTLSAPPINGTNKFLKWLTNGVDFSASQSVAWSVETNATLTAVYAPERSLAYAVQAGTARTNFTGFVGARIQVGAKPIKVSALGRYKAPGNAASHIMKVVRASDSTEVQGTQVLVSMAAGEVGTFVYQSLSAPVQLDAGAIYYLVTQETVGGDGWYDCNSTLSTTAAAQVLGGIYAFGSSSVYYTYCGNGHAYGPVDLKYEGVAEWALTVTSSNAVPASIGISPVDNDGRGSGAPVLLRLYTDGTQVAVSTPGLVNGRSFLGWYESGQQLAVTPSITLDMSRPRSVTAVYNPVAQSTTNFVVSAALGTLRNNYSGWIGHRITVGSQAMKVASLGRMVAPGNTRTHQMKIVNASNGQEVAGSSVVVNAAAGTPGQFLHVALAAPVTLQPGTAYFIVSQEASGGDAWYDINTTLTTQADATVNTGVYGNGISSWFTYGPAGTSYVPVDFSYFIEP